MRIKRFLLIWLSWTFLALSLLLLNGCQSGTKEIGLFTEPTEVLPVVISTAKPSAATSTETPTTAAPAETPATSAPTEAPTTAAPMGAPATAPAETPTTAMLKKAPATAAPAEAPVIAAPNTTPSSATVAVGDRVEFGGKQWEVTFLDDFDGTQLNSANWAYCPDWKRQDVENYWNTNQVSVEGDGFLRLGIDYDDTLTLDSKWCGAADGSPAAVLDATDKLGFGNSARVTIDRSKNVYSIGTVTYDYMTAVTSSDGIRFTACADQPMTLRVAVVFDWNKQRYADVTVGSEPRTYTIRWEDCNTYDGVDGFDVAGGGFFTQVVFQNGRTYNDPMTNVLYLDELKYFTGNAVTNLAGSQPAVSDPESANFIMIQDNIGAASNRILSGAVWTYGIFEQAYGYFEARCRLQPAVGCWSAFWLMCDSQPSVGNGGKDGAEIDIFESPWFNQGLIQSAIHWDGYGESHQSAGSPQYYLPNMYDDFHTFALEWTQTEYIFYVDGQEFWRTDVGGICEVPCYLLLTVEAGTWGGELLEEQMPACFIVDYVRVYKQV